VDPVTTSSGTLDRIREELQGHDETLAQLVRDAVAEGHTAVAVADVLGISRATLYRRFGASVRAGVVGRTWTAVVRRDV
jgi:DNA invertase Pin-like site-specific DNA recombinase